MSVVPKEGVAVAAKCVVARLLEPDCFEGRMKMATKDVRLGQLFARPGAEQQTRLAASDEFDQQFRHVLRQIDFTLPVFGLQVVMNLMSVAASREDASLDSECARPDIQWFRRS